MRTGIELIAEERQRQIEVEGWTPEHDDVHVDGQLARVAASYAMPVGKGRIDARREFFLSGIGEDWWKPSPDNRIRELVKAGALIAAEIDRLNRRAIASKA
jgi:hypothetical protein